MSHNSTPRYAAHEAPQDDWGKIELAEGVRLVAHGSTSGGGYTLLIDGWPDALRPQDDVPDWSQVLKRTGEDSLPIHLRAFSGGPAWIAVRHLAEYAGSLDNPTGIRVRKLSGTCRAIADSYIHEGEGHR